MKLHLLIPFAAVLLLASCGEQKKEKPKPPPAAVTVETVAAGPFKRLLTVTGTVEPTIVAGLASQAEGPILNCRIREGDIIAAGQELLRIGRQSSADAALAAAREELHRQEMEFERVSKLVGAGAVAAERLDSARSTLERAKAALAQAEQSSEDYSILAPWAGVVSKVHVADGNYVAPRTSLIDLYDPASLVLRFAIPEQHAFSLAVGGKIEATFDAIPDESFALEIIRAYPELDRRLRNRAFEAALPPATKFTPGMFARIRALLETQENAVTIPVDAVLTANENSFLFVLEDGKAIRRKVETGFEQDGRVWIRSGLKPGEKLIIGGVERVKDGAPVRLEGGDKGKGKAPQKSSQ